MSSDNKTPPRRIRPKASQKSSRAPRAGHGAEISDRLRGGDIYPGSRLDLFTSDEWRLIESTLRKEIRATVSVHSTFEVGPYSVPWPDNIRVGGSALNSHSSNSVWISLANPVSEANLIAGVSRWREYVEPFNRDWSFIISTNFRR